MTEEEIEGGLDSGGHICVVEPKLKMIESDKKWLKLILKLLRLIYI